MLPILLLILEDLASDLPGEVLGDPGILVGD